MTVKQTFSNHLKVLWIAIFTTALYALGLWYFEFETGIVFIFLAFYTLTVAPSFYLHISYLLRNKGMVCQILPDRICISKNGKDQIINSEDIKDIVVYKSASMERGGIPITPMEAYFFVRIFDKSNNTYELTCLLDTNIDKSISIVRGVKIFTQRGVFNNA